MKTTRLLAPIFTLAILSFSSVAKADFYVFGAGGVTVHEYTNVSSSGAYKVGIGFVSPSLLGFEASYTDFGTATITSPSGTLKMTGTNLSGVFEVPVEPLIMAFKAGVYNISANSGSTYNSVGLSWGFLLGYDMSENMTLFMDTEGYFKVDTGATLTEIPTTITFGLRYYL